MTQYTQPNKQTASDMMWDAGQGGGGQWAHCSCGKDHTVSDEEFENGSIIGYIELGGLLFVHGCDGCSATLARYENFVWSNRDTIRRYLKTRIDQEKAWADQEKLLNVLADI